MQIVIPDIALHISSQIALISEQIAFKVFFFFRPRQTRLTMMFPDHGKPSRGQTTRRPTE